jgi:hypothetical protein
MIKTAGLAALLLSFVAACGDGGSGTPDAGTSADAGPAIDAVAEIDAMTACTTYRVDVAAGDDSNAGDCAAPFKTITHALSVAVAGDSIGVAPGTYDAASGEAFPITIGDGVSLIGDEAHDGAGTTIVGSALADESNIYSTVIYPGNSALIAGFTIVNNDPEVLDSMIGIWDNYSEGVVIRHNTIDGASFGVAGSGEIASYGILMRNGAHGGAISNNVILHHREVGIEFVDAGTDMRVERNVIHGNDVGVEYSGTSVDAGGGDLGGGSAGSSGGNSISCNTTHDLWITGARVPVSASNNAWDHAPPSTQDVSNLTDVPLDLSGAVVTTMPCL